jgi:hypothetical protein
VAQRRDVGGRDAGAIEDRADAGSQTARGVIGRAGYLGDVDGAGLAIDGDDIGERAAGIDADPETAFGRAHALASVRVERPCYPDSPGAARPRAGSW